MVNCYVCGGKGNFLHLDRVICRRCFMRNMEKRVKKHLGRKKFKKGDKVAVVGELEEYLLKKAVKEMPIKITLRKRIPVDVRKYDWVIYGRTMDEVNGEFLEGLKKGKLGLERKKKFFNILEPLSAEEVKKYASLRKLKVKTGKGFEFGELGYNFYKNVKKLESFLN